MYIGRKVSSCLFAIALLCASVFAGEVKNERTGIIYTNLQEAINQAEPNDVLDLKGFFSGNFNNFSTVFADYISLILKGDLFHPAILDGGGSGSVFTVKSNSNDIGVNIEFDNLTIQNGNNANTGGGINSFYNNTIIIKNSIIINNGTSYSGGGIALDEGTLTVIDTTIANNSTQGFGGGIFLVSVRAFIIDSEIVSNMAANSGGGIYAYNGNTEFYTSLLYICNSKVDKNTTETDGGGISSEFTGVSIIHSKINGNGAGGVGGGIASAVDSYYIAESSINGNIASSDGGGIYGEEGTVIESIMSSFKHNSSGGDGGGLYGDLVVYNFFF